MSTKSGDGRVRAGPGAAVFAALAAAGVLCAFLYGVERAVRRPIDDARPPDAAAVVDGAIIRKDDVRDEAILTGAAVDDAYRPDSAAARRVLSELIERRLLAGAAVRNGVDAEPHVRRRIARARERILADEMIRRAVASAVTEETLRARYADQARLVRLGDEVRARHILVSEQAEAEAIRADLENGADFEGLAQTRSRDRATARRGGDLGWFVKNARLRAISDAAFAAQPGDLVGPFPSPLGWHVLEVLDRRPERTPPFETLRSEIERALTLETIERTLARLRAQAEIEVLEDPGEGPVVFDRPAADGGEGR